MQREYLQRLCFYTLVCLGLSLALSTASRAQNVQVNGAFHGVISDTTGAVIPGAEIVVKNLATGQIRKATTDAAGFYTITQVAPGHYSVTVSKEGFATLIQPNVELLVNQDLAADYTLKVGQVTQHVEVTAAPPMLQTANATLGQVVGSQQVVDLPLNGRQFTSADPSHARSSAQRRTGSNRSIMIAIGGGGISPATNGQPQTKTSSLSTEILNNHFYYQGYAVSPPPDAIQEFNVQCQYDGRTVRHHRRGPMSTS